MSQTIYDTTPMRQVFKEGTWDVKLSFLVMGLANLVNKQFTKGLLFLLSEIAFLVTFVIQIVPALQGMVTLGTQEQGEAVKEVNGVNVLTSVVESENMNHLKQLVDNAKSKLENYVIAFASINEDKVNFVVAVDKAITDKYNAGKLVNVLATVCDGRGGGRPDMAQAGAKNKDNINKAFEELLSNI